MKISFDPALFIWDETNADTFVYIYSELSELIIEMIELIDQYDIKIIVSNDFIEALLCSFPYSSLSRHNCEFSAYRTSVLLFIGKIECSSNNKSNQITIQYHSPTLYKPFFTQEITSSIPSILGEIVCQEDNPNIISYNNGHKKLCITYNKASPKNKSNKSNNNNYSIKCISELSNLLESIYGRLYEENIKHNTKSGWSSKLPQDLSQKELQELLEAAIPTRKGRADLVIFSEKAKCYLRYRPHTKNTFHAYPLSEQELEQIPGLKICNIPSR